MAYVDGFLTPVPRAARAAFVAHAEGWAPRFLAMGALRVVECGEVEVPRGKVNDLAMAVALEEGEEVVLSWIEWPDRATRDAAHAKMGEMIAADPSLTEMPFDGKRMVFGGFAPAHDTGEAAAPGFIDGMVVPTGKGAEDLAAYAATTAALFLAHGALRTVSCAADDVPHGKWTDFHRAAAAAEAETPIFGWIEWPSRAARDAAWGALMGGSALGAAMASAPYDPMRMAAGGFSPLIDARSAMTVA